MRPWIYLNSSFIKKIITKSAEKLGLIMNLKLNGKRAVTIQLYFLNYHNRLDQFNLLAGAEPEFRLEFEQLLNKIKNN